MSEKIERYHFIMSKADYMAKKKSGHFNGFFGDLSIYQIPATPDKFLPMLKLVGGQWGWDNKDMNKNMSKLLERLADDQTWLFHLCDNNRAIGYSMLTKPSRCLYDNFAYTPEQKIIEIENLGLFPGMEGQGRGGKFFELIFKRFFQTYDYIYWSVSSTNHSGLFNYYKERLGMTYIGSDYVDDFRPEELKKAKRKTAA